MTIEERVRRMLAEAVAAEPAPSGAPFDRAVRRRRQRSLRAAVVAVALLLAATAVVTGVHALTTKPGAVPTVPPAMPTGWKTFQNVGFYNLKFRYPPDWSVEGRGGFVIAPGQFASADSSSPVPGPFAVEVGLGPQYYLFVVQNGARVTRGRLPDGRAFIRWTSTQAGAHTVNYTIDWGQYCLSPGHDCGAKSINASIQATSQALLDRYSQVAEQIVRTFQPARPTAASTGDRNRPACRPDQWRPVFSSENKVTLDASPFAVEADLPENGGVAGDVPRGATMWFWRWDNWCRQPQPTVRVRVTADSGATTTRPLPPRSIQDPRFPCHPNAPWRIVPLP